MLSAGSMARHEKYCRYNPENKHKCFEYCTNLKRERVIQGRHLETVFTCEITGNKMYSYLAEKKKTAYFGCPIELTGIRMPLECELYKEMSDLEMEERFGL